MLAAKDKGGRTRQKGEKKRCGGGRKRDRYHGGGEEGRKKKRGEEDNVLDKDGGEPLFQRERGNYPPPQKGMAYKKCKPMW